MRKLFILFLLSVSATMAWAQLAWDHEMTRDDFNNAQIVYSKTEASWMLTGGVNVGKTSLFSDVTGEFVVALPQVGLAEKVYFQYTAVGSGTAAIYESTDHQNWTGCWTVSPSGVTAMVKDSATLKPGTKYLKFSFTGRTTLNYSKIRVQEWKLLQCSTPELSFGEAMVDAPAQSQTVYVYWTNIVADVTTPSESYTVSASTVGEKNKQNQSTALTITYNHTEAGTHNGQIVISGEGKEVRIAVSGTTKRYDQSLNWVQTPGTIWANDSLQLTASATSGLPVSYTTSDAAIATVDEVGMVHVHAAGTVEITAVQPGNYKYNPSDTIRKQLTIEKATPAVTLACDEIVYGQTLSDAHVRDTEGRVAGTVVWTAHSADEVPDAGMYVLEATFIPTNEAIYERVTRTVTLTIQRAPQTVSWEIADEVQMAVGQALEAVATATSGLDVTYAYTACILHVEDGRMVADEEGDVVVVAYQEGSDNYLPTTVLIRTIHITPALTSEVAAPEAPRGVEKTIREQGLRIRKDGVSYDALGRVLSDKCKVQSAKCKVISDK